jgi:DNA-binding LacI/PurR family transcriptional regulator/DNA-binding transcriptional regulator YhcF (GntR family)
MPAPDSSFNRLDRPTSLTARVEQLLREAIASGRFGDGRLPTEVELAEQLGVSRETVRLAAEVLQCEGLLVKIRRKGTFIRQPDFPEKIEARPSTALGYLQAGYPLPTRSLTGQSQEEGATRVVSGLMLQGAMEEAGRAGYHLVVRHAPHTQLGKAFQELSQQQRLRGVIIGSYGEEKLLRRVSGLGLPTVLLDHDTHLSGIHTVRDDSFQGARAAMLHLAELGHRSVAFANWRQVELNPWRLQGYRQGLRDAGLPRRRSWELSVELTQDGAVDAVEQFLALKPRPTALYCFNNTLARFVLDALARRGLRVAADVSVLGGGGEDVPGLTCHQADWHQMGRTAVQILLRALADVGRQTPEHHLCLHAMRTGQTTA